MTTEHIEIVVTDKGTKIVRRNIETIGKASNKSAKDIGRLNSVLRSVKGSGVGRALSRNISDVGVEARKSASGVNLLRGALGGLSVIFAGRALINLVDTYANLQNRLRLVTTGTEDLANVTEELFGIAQRTRVGFESTADAYSKIITVSNSLGVSQKETLEFVEGLNQAIVLSGVSSDQASAGLRQFIQGFGKGKLDGDELKSTVENIAGVADVLAKQLGVTRVELTKMGESGEITSKVMLEAFSNQRAELIAKFAKTIPTISQAMTNLGTAMLKYIGQVDQAAGASSVLAQAILLVSRNLHIIIPLVASLAAVITVNLVVGALGGLKKNLLLAVVGLKKFAAGVLIVSRAIKVLTLALARNPFGLLLIILTTFAATLLTISGKWEAFVDTIIGYLRKLKDIFFNVFGSIAEFFGFKAKEIDRTFDALSSSVSSLVSDTIDSGNAASDAANKAERDAARALRAAEKAKKASIAANNFTQKNNYDQRSAVKGDNFTTVGNGIDNNTGVQNDDFTITGSTAGSISTDSGDNGRFSTDGDFTGSTQKRSGFKSSGNHIKDLLSGFNARSSLTGYANGGSFQVGGNAGVDQNVLSINNTPVARVSRDETINVVPASSGSSSSSSGVGGSSGGGGNAGKYVTNFYITTPDADSFKLSQSQIEAKSQAAQLRASIRNG